MEWCCLAGKRDKKIKLSPLGKVTAALSMTVVVIIVFILVFTGVGGRFTIGDKAQTPASSSKMEPQSVKKTSSTDSAVKTPASSSSSNEKAPAQPAEEVSEKDFSGAVFMGDSITEDMTNYDVTDGAHIVSSVGASAYRAYTNHQVAINGDPKDTGWLPQRAASFNPKRIYIMFGGNDLCWGNQMTAKMFVKNYGGIVDYLKQNCRSSKIYVQSILPISSSAENSKDWPFDNSKIDQFNAALREMCAQKNVKYLDVASVFKNAQGKLSSEASDDGVHLKSKEYTKWFAYLAKNK